MEYNYLDKERQKLWDRVVALETRIENTPTKNEAEILASLEKAKEYLSQFEKIQAEILILQEETDASQEIVKTQSEFINTNFSEITNVYSDIKSIKEEVEKARNDVDNVRAQFIEKNTELQDIASKFPELQNQLEKSANAYAEINDLYAKIKDIHQTVVKQKTELDSIYYEVFGYGVEDESGSESKVPSLKDKLNDAYSQIRADFSLHQKNVKEQYVQLSSEILEFTETTKNAFSDQMVEWKGKYALVLDSINKLLPNALTAGLSYAFSDKKKEETQEREKNYKIFIMSIIAMMGVSLLPIGVSIHSLRNGLSLHDTIVELPQLAFAILPIYIPILWLAYSSSKKISLSKRLIEEYSHKEALSKTYEGLATQISNLEESCSVVQLKEKLLFNILEVSSENPGKLISDYNKSDHPLMDALDKSIKLAKSVEVLSKLPGFSRIAHVLADKADKVLKEQGVKAEIGLAILPEMDLKEDKETAKQTGKA